MLDIFRGFVVFGLALLLLWMICVLDNMTTKRFLLANVCFFLLVLAFIFSLKDFITSWVANYA